MDNIELLRLNCADEVCWGLSLAMNFNLSAKEAIDFIAKDFEAWADLVDWPEERRDKNEI